jgi:hypothetical protein
MTPAPKPGIRWCTGCQPHRRAAEPRTGCRCARRATADSSPLAHHLTGSTIQLLRSSARRSSCRQKVSHRVLEDTIVPGHFAPSTPAASRALSSSSGSGCSLIVPELGPQSAQKIMPSENDVQATIGSHHHATMSVPLVQILQALLASRGQRWLWRETAQNKRRYAWLWSVRSPCDLRFHSRGAPAARLAPKAASVPRASVNDRAHDVIP